MAGSRIPIPLTQRWRWIRFQVLPLVFFFGAAVMVSVLWSRNYQAPNAVGEVFADAAIVLATGDGVVIELPFRPDELNQVVRKDQIIVRLDNKPLLAELNAAKGDLATLVKSLDSVKEEARRSDIEVSATIGAREENDRTRWQITLQERRLEYLKIQTDLWERKAQLPSLDAQLAIKQRLVKSKMASIEDLLVIRQQREALVEAIKALEEHAKNTVAEATEAKEQLKKARESAPVQTNVDALLAPVIEEIQAQKHRVDALQAQIEQLEIRAPFDGMVRDVLVRPGMGVKIGQPILTIAASDAKFVVSYVRQGRNVLPQPGMGADIQVRAVPTRIIASHVDQVGNQVVQVPLHHQRVPDPNVPEWGQPVRIPLPEGSGLRPGELVDVRFRGNGAAATVPASRTADPHKQPPPRQARRDET